MDKEMGKKYYKNVGKREVRLGILCSLAEVVSIIFIIVGLALLFPTIYDEYNLSLAKIIGGIMALAGSVGLWFCCFRETHEVISFTAKKYVNLYNACLAVISDRQHISLAELQETLPEYTEIKPARFHYMIKEMCDKGWFIQGEVIDDVLCVTHSAADYIREEKRKDESEA